ncbi:hypothetical protein TSUD_145200 [Trifolium subterraneum]|uniref:Uncharacterized protein n=1 Tax=Trifolium subterraneum TaxID=3900 RepID=A0A2Z6N7U1_TRISU|nr:hypothetical protein TSUD_145200 [Trifolium subterraneum]
MSLLSVFFKTIRSWMNMVRNHYFYFRLNFKKACGSMRFVLFESNPIEELSPQPACESIPIEDGN